VCFKAGHVPGARFVRTGVAVLVQMDVLGVTVNSIRPNQGTHVALRPHIRYLSLFIVKSGMHVALPRAHIRYLPLRIDKPGTHVALPRAPGSSLSWSRVLADVGFREVIQAAGMPKEPYMNHKEPYTNYEEPYMNHKEPYTNYEEPYTNYKEPYMNHKEPCITLNKSPIHTLPALPYANRARHARKRALYKFQNKPA